MPRRIGFHELASVLSPDGLTLVSGCSAESAQLADMVETAGAALGDMTFCGVARALTGRKHDASAATVACAASVVGCTAGARHETRVAQCWPRPARPAGSSRPNKAEARSRHCASTSMSL